MNWHKVINWLVGISLLVSLIFNGLQFYYIHNQNAPECVYVSDTIVLRKDSIIEKTKFITKRDTVVQFIRINDVDTIHDTLMVSIPIEHKTSEFTIKKDSLTINETIHHSGWHTNIDSIECNYTFNYEIMKPKPKKFGWCITFGPSISYDITLDTYNKTWSYGPSAGFSIVIGPSYIIR